MLSVKEILAKLKKSSAYYTHVRKDLREDKDFSILAIKINPSCYFENSFLFRGDKDVNKVMLKTGNLKIISKLVYSEELLKSDEEYKKLKEISVEAGQRVGYLSLLGSIYSENKDYSFHEDFYNLTIGNEMNFVEKHFKK